MQVEDKCINYNKDGEEFFTEYPYECMIFDDEDNPIYK